MLPLAQNTDRMEVLSRQSAACDLVKLVFYGLNNNIIIAIYNNFKYEYNTIFVSNADMETVIMTTLQRIAQVCFVWTAASAYIIHRVCSKEFVIFVSFYLSLGLHGSEWVSGRACGSVD